MSTGPIQMKIRAVDLAPACRTSWLASGIVMKSATPGA